MNPYVSGVVYIDYFSPTGNPNEYEIFNAKYTSQTDLTWSGAYGLHEGCIIYTQVMDINTFIPLVGRVNRFKITSIDVLDVEYFNATIVLDQPEELFVVPMDYSVAMISSAADKGFGMPVSPDVYSVYDLPPGLAINALALDNFSVTDKLGDSGGSVVQPPPVKNYTHRQEVPETIWRVRHNLNSVEFTYSMFADNHEVVIPNTIEVMTQNLVFVQLLAPMSGRIHMTFF